MTHTPPSLRYLLKDPAYRRYFARPPKPHKSVSPDPWAIIAVSEELRYGKKCFPTFSDAFQYARDLMKRRDDIMDVSIFAKNVISPTPQTLASALMSPTEDWCGRCRRPSLFRVYADYHPALRDAPVIVPDLRRCFYCGISWEYLTHGQ